MPLRPESVLGFDPVPTDPSAAIELASTVHAVVGALVEGQRALELSVRTGTVWDGALGAPVAAVVRGLAGQLGELADLLIACRESLDEWRLGLQSRRSEVAAIVESISTLPDGSEPAARRGRLVAHAREIEGEQRAADGRLRSAFEELRASAEKRSQVDLEHELAEAVRALDSAVESWVASEGSQLVRTALALGEVAALTTVISELVGVADLDRAPGDAEGVAEIVSRSPAAHRLVRALHRRWSELAPAGLPPATFARDRATTELTGALAGRLAGGELDGEDSRT